MELSEFDYNLAQELIAQYPLLERDKARLMVISRPKGTIEHKVFKDVAGFIHKGDLLVLNDTKVRPCRLKGRRKTGGRVELLLLHQKSDFVFEVLVKPGRLRSGEEIIFEGSGIRANLSSKNEVTFSAPDTASIYDLGEVPLPPYIKREPQELDKEYYQTVYAREPGAVASPTAGLHFTQDLLSSLRTKGVNIAYVTLHVGHATFRPVKSEDITKHEMGHEYFRIGEEACDLLAETHSGKGRVFCVGTTSCRALEAYAAGGEREGRTNLFIYPGYKFQMTDCLLTNFHLPRTTLFMLVCAFCGTELAKRAYQEAVREKYRFYSYGDAMLIL